MTTEIVNYEGDARRTLSDMRAGESGIVSSLPSATQDEKLDILAYLNTEARIDDLVKSGEVFELKHYIMHIVTVVEDNDPREVLRTVLVTADGRAFAATSDGVASSMKQLLDMLGDPASWEFPVPMKIVEAKSRKGRDFFTFKVVRKTDKK